jgi:hypothetical protein
MNLFRSIKNMVGRYIRIANAPLLQMVQKEALLTATFLSMQSRAIKHLLGLHEVEFCVYSQWGEDGIIDWLIDRLPGIPPTFIEFGVENYQESNTRLLLQLRNWRGLVLDGSQKHIDDIKGQEIYWKHELSAVCAFIDKDNINGLISNAGLSGDVGLLSVDIDGNDYWVWQAIEIVNPVIVVCEYNAVLGDIHSVSVPYQATFQRTKADPSNLYFGASIRALIALGKSKGYTFVGSTSTGANAFFIRNDYADLVVSALDGVYAFPSKFREARDGNGRLLYLNGNRRRELIDRLPFVDPSSGKSVDLKALGNIYSPNWTNGVGEKF